MRKIRLKLKRKDLKNKYFSKNRLNKKSIHKIYLDKFTFTDFINFKPEYPNIFYLYKIDESLFSEYKFIKQQELFSLLYSLKSKNAYIFKFLHIGFIILDKLEKFLMQKNKEWKITNISPFEIATDIYNLKNAPDIEKENIFKQFSVNNNEKFILIKYYNVNWCMFKDDSSYKYIYFTKKGIEEVDNFLTSNLINIDKNKNYKQISYGSEIMRELSEQILKGLKENYERAKMLKKASTNKTISMITHSMLYLEKKLPLILKNIITNVIQTNKYQVDKDQIAEEFIIFNNIKWFKLTLSETKLERIVGETFLEIHSKFILDKEKKNMKIQETTSMSKSDRKRHRLCIEYFIEVILLEIIKKIKISKIINESDKQFIIDNQYNYLFYIKNTFVVQATENLTNSSIVNEYEKIILEYVKPRRVINKNNINDTDDTKDTNDSNDNINQEIKINMPTQSVTDERITMIYFIVYYECISTNKIDTTLIPPLGVTLKKILNYYLDPKITICELDMGKLILNQSLNSLFYKTKEILNENSIVNKKNNKSKYNVMTFFMNDAFYRTTIPIEMLPSFGPFARNPNAIRDEIIKDIIMEEKENLMISPHNKLIIPSNISNAELPIKFSGKFKIKDISHSIESQIEYDKKLFTKLNFETVEELMNALIYILNANTHIELLNLWMKYPIIRTYLLPVDTNNIFFDKKLKEETKFHFIYSMLGLYSEEDFYASKTKFQQPANFIGPLDELESTYVEHSYKYLLRASVKTNKFELQRILFTILFCTCFSGWYSPRWFDARLRKYPEEHPLNITKSPKFRGLIELQTSLTGTLSPEEFSNNRVDNGIMLDKYLTAKIKVTLDNIKNANQNNIKNVSQDNIKLHEENEINSDVEKLSKRQKLRRKKKLLKSSKLINNHDD